MSAKAAQASGLVSTPNSSQLSKKRSLFILISVLIVFLLLIAAGGILLLTKNPNIIKRQKELIVLENIVFPSSESKKRFEDKLKTIGEAKDKYKLYEELFSDLKAVYSVNRDTKTRVELEKLGAYVKSKYPDESGKQPVLYKVDCLDTACGSPNFPPEIKKIKAELETMDSLDKTVIDSVNSNFETAAYLADKKRQWGPYSAVFGSLEGQYQLKKSEKLKGVLLELRGFLEANYPYEYGLAKRNNPKAVEVD